MIKGDEGVRGRKKVGLRGKSLGSTTLTRQHHQGITKDSRSKSKVEPFKKSESSIMIINFFALKLTIPGDDDDDDDVCDIVDLSLIHI